MTVALLSGEAPAEDILPIAVPVSRYSSIWEKSPFNREVVKIVSTAQFSALGKNLTLEGIVHDDIVGPIAYVRNLTDNQPLMITSRKSESHPYRIISANEVNDPRDSRVTITDGLDNAEIGYSDNLMTQTIKQAPRNADQSKPKTNVGGTTAAQNPPTNSNGDTSKNGQPNVNLTKEAEDTTQRKNRILLPPRPQN